MKISHRFKDKELLDLALTHRSAKKQNNERLEFLGDAILGSVIAEYLYTHFPAADEGQLTRTRASLVNKKFLATIARELEIGAQIALGEGELKSGGWQRDSILSNTVEAIIGAIYLDNGYDSCRAEILAWYASALAEVNPAESIKDPKTQLQELLQSKNLALPNYETLKIDGPAHQQLFTVRCEVALLEKPVLETSNSRRRAEQKAAETVLRQLQEQSDE